jgi:uncharacterized membrane protein YecN with MAPEG domain
MEGKHMLLPITSLTAAFAAIMLVALTIITGLRRTTTGTLLGEGTDATLLRRIRAHGNFTEQVPIALILLGLCEIREINLNVLWAMAGLLIGGRILHAIGILGTVMPARGIGMLMTLASILTGAMMLLRG